MECYSAIKWNEVLIHASTRTSLKNLTLSRSQTLYDPTYEVSSRGNSQRQNADQWFPGVGSRNGD